MGRSKIQHQTTEEVSWETSGHFPTTHIQSRLPPIHSNHPKFKLTTTSSITSNHEDQFTDDSSTLSGTNSGSFSLRKPKFKPKSTKNKASLYSSDWISTWITDWWGIELICWLISALSLLAIVVMLETYKQKPLPQWPLKITLNSFISIFAQIAQIAMMKPVVECISQLKWLWFSRKQKLLEFGILDDASRGPTGSLMLLGRLGGRHLISLGAAITIISIAFGPFAQQVVSYPSRLQPVGNATCSSVVNFTGTSDLHYNTPGSELQALLFEGLSSETQNLSTVATSCSTGNCTFDTYPSLGICASVVDISDSIMNHTCNISALDAFFKEEGAQNPGYPCYNYTIPYSGLVPVVKSTNTIMENYIFDNISLSNAANVHSFDGNLNLEVLVIAQDIRNSSLASYYMLYQPNLQSSLTSSFLEPPIAYYISLNLCLGLYNTTVSNGETNTLLLESKNLALDEQLSPNNYSFRTSSGTLKDKFRGFNFSASRLGLDFLSETVWGILTPGLCYFNTNESVPAGNRFPPPGPDNTFYCTEDFFGEFINFLNNYSDPFWVTKQVADNIAISLTNGFRTGANGDTDIMMVQGIALAPVNYVAIQYLWFFLPVALISITLVFLLATILKSQRLGSRVWKSSNLATMQGLHIDLHTKLGGLSSLSEMEERAELIKVRFDMEGGKAEHGVDYRLVEEKFNHGWGG